MQIRLVVRARILASKFDASPEKVPNKAGGCRDASVLRRNVLFQTCFRIDGELPALVNGAAKARVILASIDIVGIILRVVNARRIYQRISRRGN
jgi:hypothetical protein